MPPEKIFTAALIGACTSKPTAGIHPDILFKRLRYLHTRALILNSTKPKAHPDRKRICICI